MLLLTASRLPLHLPVRPRLLGRLSGRGYPPRPRRAAVKATCYAGPTRPRGPVPLAPRPRSSSYMPRLHRAAMHHTLTCHRWEHPSEIPPAHLPQAGALSYLLIEAHLLAVASSGNWEVHATGCLCAFKRRDSTRNALWPTCVGGG